MLHLFHHQTRPKDENALFISNERGSNLTVTFPIIERGLMLTNTLSPVRPLPKVRFQTTLYPAIERSLHRRPSLTAGNALFL